MRSPSDDFFVENGRLAARSGLFREDPVNLIRLFHVADAKGLDIHPATLRSVTRLLDLIGDDLRNDPKRRTGCFSKFSVRGAIRNARSGA